MTVRFFTDQGLSGMGWEMTYHAVFPSSTIILSNHLSLSSKTHQYAFLSQAAVIPHL